LSIVFYIFSEFSIIHSVYRTGWGHVLILHLLNENLLYSFFVCIQSPQFAVILMHHERMPFASWMSWSLPLDACGKFIQKRSGSMSQPMMEKRIPVSGMTCTGCETRIEGALTALPGVMKAQASVKDGTVVVTYDPQKVKPEAFQKAIENQGYTVGTAKAKPEANASQKSTLAKTAGIGALVLTFVLLGSHFGWFQVFNLFPVASSETSFGMLFVIGLLTSVHCVAMCGGINLSQCLAGNGQGRFSGLMPSLKYNLGRVISYTVIGGIVGAIGSAVQFTGTLRGVVQLLAGVFMVLMGISLSGLFPSLARFTPHLPKALGRKINREKRESNSPLYVGLLNGLMPCGPLQAMQLYALSTGSIIGGATSMLLFSLGTVPLMFILGALSSILSRKFTKYMVTVGAVLVVVMGISMFQNGLALSGISTGAGVAQSEPAQTAAAKAEASNPTAANSGIQEITSELTRSGYPAITVKAGKPVSESGSSSSAASPANASATPAVNFASLAVTPDPNTDVDATGLLPGGCCN